ncbi:hypothetical protein MJO28_005625 [Puccinia striiformis f. sp. tritici]|uniref:Uncharacterized protein n=1 Tax=Puccinia striiformis f. sp. tritici TaxID=168172 RepID=A0ACC0EL82_9BASI|nr:hypothetical protein MJO28_005625 [Puccinia striiformis f. sp. tritici]
MSVGGASGTQPTTTRNKVQLRRSLEFWASKPKELMPALGDKFKPIVLELIREGKTNGEILRHLEEVHHVRIAERTLTRRKGTWGLSQDTNKQEVLLEELIIKYFGDGLTNSQIHHSSIDMASSLQALSNAIKNATTREQLARNVEDLEEEEEESEKEGNVVGLLWDKCYNIFGEGSLRGKYKLQKVKSYYNLRVV